ncbi:hypothetical protein [Streptomyces qinglanensis]|uniref:hypothetical protein n=1 Tax=Streptomyces qinglanensis TaxID=943816 RepID=UPI003D744D9E
MRTRLSWAHIRRLSDLVAEEAKNPTTPRNVLRDRRRTRPARVRVVEPRQDVLPSPADTDEPTTTGGPHQPPHQQANAHEKAIASPEPEPEQLSLMCI